MLSSNAFKLWQRVLRWSRVRSAIQEFAEPPRRRRRCRIRNFMGRYRGRNSISCGSLNRNHAPLVLLALLAACVPKNWPVSPWGLEGFPGDKIHAEGYFDLVCSARICYESGPRLNYYLTISKKGIHLILSVKKCVKLLNHHSFPSDVHHRARSLEFLYDDW